MVYNHQLWVLQYKYELDHDTGGDDHSARIHA
jgi:hypothetical protein